MIFDSEGNPPDGGNELQDFIDRTARNLSYVNRELHPNLHFYICQVDEIWNTYAHTRQSPVDIISTIEEDHPEIVFHTNSINLFINQESYGVGYFPLGIKLPGESGGRLALHEFGHFFGLYHTFQYTGSPNFGCGIRLFPDHSPNPLCPPIGYGTCEDEDGDGEPDYGRCYGDFIADTRVDVYCNGALTNSSCIHEVNGEEYVYHPDYSNAMSYYYTTRIMLTSGQRNRVMEVFEDPDLGVPPIGGDMSILVNDEVPACDDIYIEEDFLPVAGDIHRMKYCASAGEFVASPFGWGELSIVYSFGQPDNAGFSWPRYVTNGRYEIVDLDNLIDARIDFSGMIPGNGIFISEWDSLKPNYDISILDILRIQRHLLGLEELPKPYYWIAADVNNTGTITTLDLIELQRIILGISDNLENTPPWRFIPKYSLSDDFDFALEFNDNPFSAIWEIEDSQYGYLSSPTTNSYLGDSNPNANDQYANVLHFPMKAEEQYFYDYDTWSYYAIKTGDVSDVCTDNVEDVRFWMDVDPHSCIDVSSPIKLTIEVDQMVDQLEGVQLTFNINKEACKFVSFKNNQEGLISADDINISEDKITIVWYNDYGETGSTLPMSLSQGDVLFELSVIPRKEVCDLRDMIALSDSQNNMGITHFNDDTEGQNRSIPAFLNELALKLTHHEVETPDRNIEVFPNPIGENNNELNFTVEMNTPTPINIQLWDVFGNNIYHEFQEDEVSGEVPIPINVSDFMPGMVYYLVEIDGELHSGYFIKM